jgi:hypothetical protein
MRSCEPVTELFDYRGSIAHTVGSMRGMPIFLGGNDYDEADLINWVLQNTKK